MNEKYDNLKVRGQGCTADVAKRPKKTVIIFHGYAKKCEVWHCHEEKSPLVYSSVLDVEMIENDTPRTL